MKVNINQGVLSKGLSIVGRAVASRPTLPVLSHVLLRANGSLLLAGTDLETMITCRLAGRVDADGSITIPARLLTDLVNSLPPEQVDLALNEAQLHVACARNEADINGIPADEFPLLPEDKAIRLAELQPYVWADALGQVVFAAASDESRPVLTAVCFVFDGDTLTLVAADGFRLSVRKVKVEDKRWQPAKVLVPARALQELVRLLRDEGEPVTISTLGTDDVRQILFHLPGGGTSEGEISDIHLYSQVVAGNYVNYAQIIPNPETRKTRTFVSRSALIATCKAAQIFARAEADLLYLAVSDGQLKVSASSSEMGDYENVLDVQVEGEPITIAFSVRFLLEALSAMRTETVALDTYNAARPGVLREVGGGNEINDNFLHVIMPMHVRGGKADGKA